MMDGIDELRTFRRSRDEAAFEALVRRYSRLVLAVARRGAESPDAANDVAQTVFLRLAQNPPDLRAEAELLAWFHRAAVNAVIDSWRSRSRRQAREQALAPMDTTDTPDAAYAWEPLAPVLDEALQELTPPDREAILLRYFQEQPMRAIGDSLGISEDAAKMRVHRALERLRALLLSRGIAGTAAALARTLERHALRTGFETSPVLDVAALLARVEKPPIGAAGASLAALVPKSPFGILAAVLLTSLTGLWIARTLLFPMPAPDNAPVSRAQPGPAGPDQPPSLRASNPGNLANFPFGSVRERVDDAALADAELALRALLTRPPATNRYPPEPLTRALNAFGDRLERAVSILAEYARNPDYETRAWALTGMQHALWMIRSAETTTTPSPRLLEAWSMAHPVLAEIVLDGEAPGLLRSSALTSLLPPTIYRDGHPMYPTLLPEALNTVVQALAARGTQHESFRYEIVDAITVQALPPDHPAWATFETAARRLLGSPSDTIGRRVAAFALAHWEKAEADQVLPILREHLNSNTTHNYRAVTALGKLGPAAADALGDLKAYANNLMTQGRGRDGSFLRHALGAICRIDPAERQNHPEIAEQLRLEEAAEARRRDPSATPTQTVAEWAASIVRSGRAERVTLSFMHDPVDREEARQTLLRRLEAELDTAPENLRADIAKACEIVRTAVIPQEPDVEATRKLGLNDLALTARVLAIDLQSSKEVAINEALETLRSPNGVGPQVTPEGLDRISKALIAIDPEFEKAWRKQLKRDYPWLDRIVPGL